MQLQVKLQKTAKITELEANKQQSTADGFACSGCCEKVPIAFLDSVKNKQGPGYVFSVKNLKVRSKNGQQWSES